MINPSTKLGLARKGFYLSGASAGGGGGATALDTFIRANANPLSNPMSDGTSTWTNNPGAFTDAQIVSNLATGTGSNDAGGRVLSPTFTGQHSASVTLNSTTELWGPCVRMQGTSNASCYACITGGNNTTLRFWKITDSGTISYIQLGSDVTVSAMSTGDIIKLTATGTSTVTLTVYVNGSFAGTATDSSGTYTGGQPGFWSANGAGNIQGFSATDF